MSHPVLVGRGGYYQVRTAEDQLRQDWFKAHQFAQKIVLHTSKPNKIQQNFQQGTYPTKSLSEFDGPGNLQDEPKQFLIKTQQINPSIDLFWSTNQESKTKNQHPQKIWCNLGLRITMGIVILFSLGLVAYFQSLILDHAYKSRPQVAGAKQKLSPEQIAYKSWITERLGKYAEPDGDEDNDGLTNLEEFNLNSDPNNTHTCQLDKSDAQLVAELTDPSTCKPANLEDDEVWRKFNLLIQTGKVQNILQSSIDPQGAEPSTSISQANMTDQNILSLFGTSNYADLTQIKVTDLEQNIQQEKIKVEYLRLIHKIDSYMRSNRSYEPYDRDYELPVPAGVFLNVSVKYNTPLKYVLALAQMESRFGTDRFTNDGQLTRPGQYKNMYAIGLTDDGQNLAFSSWEEGVERFGQWYKYFQDRGVSDCRKWRIYNPNGDYCSKVETLANQIDIYLQN